MSIGAIYTSGGPSSGGIKYWLYERETEYFAFLRKLKWSENLSDEEGVMYRSQESVRVKRRRDGGLWKDGLGWITECKSHIVVKS